MSARQAPMLGTGVAPAPTAGDGAYVLGTCVHSSARADIYHVHAADADKAPPFPLLMKLAHASAAAGQGFVHSEVEHQVLPRLHGPHVPRVVAALALTQAPRLVMEWVPGRSLQSWLDAAQSPASEEVLRLGVALARAVHEVHRQHAVHHDLRPEHVQIRPDGVAVLLGWGRAWHARLPDLLSGLRSEQQVGSSAYLAPEQVLGQRGDPRSDVFAIGVILYQLLTGALPFGAPRSALGMRRRLWQIPVPPRRYKPTLTLWLEAVVLRCLEPEAGWRYPSAAHLAFDLLHPQAVPTQVSLLGRWQQRWAHRWRGALRALGMTDPPPSPPLPGEANAPIVLLALTPEAIAEPQPEYLRQALRRTLGAHRCARLLCVAVLPIASEPPHLALQDRASQERRCLAKLRVWTRSLVLPGREPACRVLAGDAAVPLLLECAHEHEVSDIVLNAIDWPAPLAQQLAQESSASVLLVRPAPR